MAAGRELAWGSDRKGVGPFFATRSVGRNAGLGLSVVHGIVRAHGGDIQVSSVPEQGTTFRIALPVSECAEPPVEREAARRPARGIVLVVEQATAEAYAGLLEVLGYHPCLAGSRVQALAARAELADDLSGIILDVVLEDAHGRALYEELAAAAPQVPVIGASGYPGTLGAETSASEETVFLSKPFRMDDLSQALAKVTAGSAEV